MTARLAAMLVFTLLVVLVLTPMPGQTLTAPRISVQDAARLLEAKGAVFVDIRKDEAWSRSGEMIRTAVRRSRWRVENWVREIPGNMAVVVYDEAGDESVSANVVLELIREGHRPSYVLQGGFQAWKGAGMPVEKK